MEHLVACGVNCRRSRVTGNREWRCRSLVRGSGTGPAEIARSVSDYPRSGKRGSRRTLKLFREVEIRRIGGSRFQNRVADDRRHNRNARDRGRAGQMAGTAVVAGQSICPTGAIVVRAGMSRACCMTQGTGMCRLAMARMACVALAWLRGIASGARRSHAVVTKWHCHCAVALHRQPQREKNDQECLPANLHASKYRQIKW